MPSKKRLNKAKEDKAAWELLGPPPIRSQKFVFAEISKPPVDKSQRIYDRGLVVFDEEGNAFLHPNHNKGAQEYNQGMSQERSLYAKALKQKYPIIWGLRSAAKVIAINENLSVRTVQKYFKDFP